MNREVVERSNLSSFYIKNLKSKNHTVECIQEPSLYQILWETSLSKALSLDHIVSVNFDNLFCISNLSN